jgi:hypothetical protein
MFDCRTRIDLQVVTFCLLVNNLFTSSYDLFV